MLFSKNRDIASAQRDEVQLLRKAPQQSKWLPMIGGRDIIVCFQDEKKKVQF